MFSIIITGKITISLLAKHWSEARLTCEIVKVYRKPHIGSLENKQSEFLLITFFFFIHNLLCKYEPYQMVHQATKINIFENKYHTCACVKTSAL